MEPGPVVFRDRSADFALPARSTATSDNTYLVVDVEISAASHPFWTGRNPWRQGTRFAADDIWFHLADDTKATAPASKVPAAWNCSARPVSVG